MKKRARPAGTPPFTDPRSLPDPNTILYGNTLVVLVFLSPPRILAVRRGPRNVQTLEVGCQCSGRTEQRT